MKSLSCAILILAVTTPYTSAFAPLMRPIPSRSSLSLSMVEEAVESDVSIPYDSAARLAYDEWRIKYEKGEFDTNRYLNFKNNYETITVANVAAKKRARDEGTVSISLMTLNEFGDLSEEEYKLATTTTQSSSSSVPTSTGDVLSKALEAAELQVQASTALGEAADALAEEEEKLMEMLGLESLEELEIALDSLEGIASDGGELDSENIAREARIRDAYLKWCKQYDKEPDESRFPTFSNNFLMLEQYAKESAKEMTLNQYADFTKEEYEAMQTGGSVPATASATATNGATDTTTAPKALSGLEKILATAAKAAQSAKESFETSLKSAGTAAKSVDISVDRDELVETATNSIENFMEIAAKGIDAGLTAIDEKGPETEEERADREARMKALEEERIQAEKREAEARAKRATEMADKAQQEALRRKAIEDERAAREKALLAEAAKAKADAEKATIAAAQAAAAAEAARTAQRAKVEAEAAQQAREKARAWDEQQKKLNAQRRKVVEPEKKGWTFAFPSGDAKSKSLSKPTPVALKPPAKKTVAVAAKKVSPAPSTPFSFFPAPSAVKPTQPKKVTAPSPSFSIFSTPPKAAVKKSAPVPIPKKATTPSPSFSLFSSPPKVAVKKAAPASPKSQPFSFFGSSPSSSIEKPNVAAKASTSSGSIGLFAPKPVQKRDVKVPARAGTISINASSKEPAKPAQKTFTIFNKPKVEASPAKKAEPAQKAPAFSFFGSSPVTKSAPAPKKPEVVVPNRSGTLSIFGTKAPPPANVPVLSQWRQNADGSIVGKVSNSKGFRAGTEITTSPVKKGAKAGSVVTTGSGSKYYLN